MNSVVIVAGGRGERMESPIPKQFMHLSDQPVLMLAMKAFIAFDPDIRIVLVLPANQFDYWDELCDENEFSFKHERIAGGKNRFESVKKGLSCLTNEGLIAIHDGVRPLVTPEFIKSVYQGASIYGNAVPAQKLSESVRLIDDNGNHIIDRDSLRFIQTPQVFKADQIKNAYNRDYEECFTDDASVLEAAGQIIHLCEGQPGNIKITTIEDIIYARAIITYEILKPWTSEYGDRATK